MLGPRCTLVLLGAVLPVLPAGTFHPLILTRCIFSRYYCFFSHVPPHSYGTGIGTCGSIHLVQVGATWVCLMIPTYETVAKKTRSLLDGRSLIPSLFDSSLVLENMVADLTNIHFVALRPGKAKPTTRQSSIILGDLRLWGRIHRSLVASALTLNLPSSSFREHAYESASETCSHHNSIDMIETIVQQSPKISFTSSTCAFVGPS